MQIRCPKCNKQLPKVETLEYRFCPNCGAEIIAEPERLDEAYLTIPPDTPPPQADRRPDALNPETEKKLTVAGPFDDRTIAPQPITLPNRPQIKPPAEPPPPTFFRKPAKETDTPPPILKKQLVTKAHTPPPKPKKQPPTKNYNKVIFAVLILLAVVILILGGLFTF